MRKNEPIRNLAEATPEGHPARAPGQNTSEKTPAPVPLEGRIEKRVPLEVHVCLLLEEQQLAAENAITVNVSPHGARVLTRRFWHVEERPWLAPPTSESRQRARVIYCQPQTEGHFCVGLEFRPGFINWAGTPWS
jgi:PilZ domain-containing protein